MKKIIFFLLLSFNLGLLKAQLSFSSKSGYYHKDIFQYNGKTYMLGSPDMSNARNKMYDLLKTFELFEIDTKEKSVVRKEIDLKPLAKDFSQYNFYYYRKGKYLIFEYNLLSYTRVSELCKAFCYDLEKGELHTINIEQKKKMENKIYSIDLAQNGEDVLYVFVNRSKYINDFTGEMSCDFDIVKYNLTTGTDEVNSISFNDKYSIGSINMMNEGQLFVALRSKDGSFWAIYDDENKEIKPISFDLKNKYFSTYYLLKIGDKWYFEIKTGTENKINDTEVFEINMEEASGMPIEPGGTEYNLVINNKKNTIGNDDQFFDLVSEDKKIIYTYFQDNEPATKEIELGITTNITSKSVWDYNNETKYYILNNELHIYVNNSSDVGGKIYTIVVDLKNGEVKEKNQVKKLNITKVPYLYMDENGNVASIFISYDKKMKQVNFSFDTNEF